MGTDKNSCISKAWRDIILPHFTTAILEERMQKIPQAVIEFLEARRMLSTYNTVDYFPTTPGTTWSYSGTYKDQAATRKTTVLAASIGGVGVSRFEDSFQVSAEPADKGSSFLRLSKDGLFVYQLSSRIGLDTTVQLTFAPPLKILNAILKDGQIASTPKVVTSFVLEGPSIGRIAGSGTTGATFHVWGKQRRQLPDGRLVAALKITMDTSISLSGRGSFGVMDI